ncbi:hypothetical protein EG327_009344 [Venturia inaequalis]|uniref:Uncharacterized protein n=1 Tax=Venturia inaequalis TaxID=5025 RepID=A0A8H3YTI1_VENIN|nr:hypothetical protein EG327_009344 [Venturia inaequalis]
MQLLSSISIITILSATITASPIPNPQTFVVPPEELVATPEPPAPILVPAPAQPPAPFPPPPAAPVAPVAPIAPVAPQGWAPPPWPNQPPAPTLGQTQPQPQPPATSYKDKDQKNKPYIESDASGLTLSGTYHKGPDGTYIKGGLGTIDAQKGAPTYYQSGLGTVTSGQGVWKYDPKNTKGPYGEGQPGGNNVVRNIVHFLGIAGEGKN